MGALWQDADWRQQNLLFGTDHATFQRNIDQFLSDDIQSIYAGLRNDNRGEKRVCAESHRQVPAWRPWQTRSGSCLTRFKK